MTFRSLERWSLCPRNNIEVIFWRTTENFGVRLLMWIFIIRFILFLWLFVLLWRIFFRHRVEQLHRICCLFLFYFSIELDLINDDVLAFHIIKIGMEKIVLALITDWCFSLQKKGFKHLFDGFWEEKTKIKNKKKHSICFT